MNLNYRGHIPYKRRPLEAVLDQIKRLYTKIWSCISKYRFLWVSISILTPKIKFSLLEATGSRPGRDLEDKH